MIIIVDTGGANLGSIQFCLQRLGTAATLSADPVLIAGAEKVLLPGVGAAADSMKRLEQAELIPVLRGLTCPVLGICLGMQLLFESSEEGDVACLGLLPGRVRKLQPEPGIRVPHIGWNQLALARNSSLMNGVNGSDYFYFVHSFAAPCTEHTVATTVNGGEFASVVQRDNFFGAQFHPERSSASGNRFIRNFLEL
ncbi:MAG: imidazole glycerol phosphate synthase subunit HisH [Kofleriaceae bacterium]|nr:imidazole glycerol phosphate synthase subunit HisH [Kofleriaceae bacterium]